MGLVSVTHILKCSVLSCVIFLLTIRLVDCKFKRLGCPWQGPYHEVAGHQENLCSYPEKKGMELMGYLDAIDEKHAKECKLFDSITGLLSYEKITING